VSTGDPKDHIIKYAKNQENETANPRRDQYSSDPKHYGFIEMLIRGGGRPFMPVCMSLAQ